MFPNHNCSLYFAELMPLLQTEGWGGLIAKMNG